MANGHPNEPMNSEPDESGAGSAEVESLAALLGRFRHFLFGPAPAELPAEERDALVSEAMRRTQGIRPTPSERHPSRRAFRLPVKALAWAAILLVCVATGVWFWATGGHHLSRREAIPKTGMADSNMLGLNPPPLGDDPLGMGEERLAGAEQHGLFPAVYFDRDSAMIKPSEKSKIEEVASRLKGMEGVSVVVEGHCDERGSAKYNLALGERRALAVRACLIELGVKAERIQTKSCGEENPVALGHDAASWRLNSRCEFVLIQ